MRDGMELEEWRARARTWQPFGSIPVPHEELARFLKSCRAFLQRAPKATLLGAFAAWSECVRALADNPLVLLHGESASLIVSSALVVLAKVSPADVRDELLRKRCVQAEWWCTSFLRQLSGGPHAAPDAGAPADACMPLVSVDTASMIVAQRDACVRDLVHHLQQARSTSETHGVTPRTSQPAASGVDRLTRLLMDSTREEPGTKQPAHASPPPRTLPVQQPRSSSSLGAALGPLAVALIGQARDDEPLRRATMPLLRELCRHSPPEDLAELPLGARAIGELLASGEPLADPAGAEEAPFAKVPSMLARHVQDMVIEMHVSCGLQALVAAAAAAPPASTHARRAAAGAAAEEAAATAAGSSFGRLERAADGACAALERRLPQLCAVAHACAHRPELLGFIEICLWQLESTAGCGGAPLLMLRLLRHAVARVCADTAATVHGSVELRHLRWRLSLARSPPALRVVQAEVARLVARREGAARMVAGVEGSKRRREEQEAEPAAAAAAEEAEEEEEDLVTAAIASARVAMSDHDAVRDVSAASEAEQSAAEKAYRERRLAVWRCLACHPGWAQSAAMQMLLQVADGGKGDADLAFVLWCACPAGAYAEGSEESQDEPSVPEREADVAAKAEGLSVSTTRSWLRTLAADVTAVAASQTDEAAAAASLAQRLAAWMEQPGAHAGLAWQLVFAAACVASQPVQWVRLALHAAWQTGGGAQDVHDGGISSRLMEWMWHMLTFSLTRGTEGAPPPLRARMRALAEAAASGAALVAARRPGDKELEEAARLLRIAAQESDA